LPWWHFGGKVIPWLCRKLKLLPLAVTQSEKKGFEDVPVTRMSVVQKRILARQLKLWDNRLLHAQAVALAWKENLKLALPESQIIIPNLAFRTLVKLKHVTDKEDFEYQLKQSNAPYHLDDWQGVPISPQGISYKQFGYRPGQCKQAEYFARTYLTFPTNIRTQKADTKHFAKYLSRA